MDITARKLTKSIKENKSHNSKLLSEGSRFNRSQQRKLKRQQDDFRTYISDADTEDNPGRYAWASLFIMVKWHIELGQMLALDRDQHETKHMVQAAHYGYWWLKLGPDITPKYRAGSERHSDISLMDACRVISYLLLTGHHEAAAEVTHICATELKTPFINGGIDWWLHPWFLLQLVCRWQNITLDLTDCDIPTDMNIYPQVLANWDTTDINQVQQLVNKMADFHMATAKSDMSDNETNDFNESAFWFFPYEILAWLRIRELMGLPNPETYEHPLMQQPLGQMPPDTPFPEDELLMQVVAKLKADHGIA